MRAGVPLIGATQYTFTNKNQLQKNHWHGDDLTSSETWATFECELNQHIPLIKKSKFIDACVILRVKKSNISGCDAFTNREILAAKQHRQ